jgi:hypothetical protein
MVSLLYLYLIHCEPCCGSLVMKDRRWIEEAAHCGAKEMRDNDGA